MSAFKTDGARAAGAPLRVWDRPVRLLHWGLAACVAMAWWSSDDTGPLHERVGYVALALLACVALHVGGVLWTCLQHRENLVRAMVTGRKAPPRGDDVA